MQQRFMQQRVEAPFTMIMHTPTNTPTIYTHSTHPCLQILPSVAHFLPTFNENMRKQESNECSGARYIGVRKRKWGRWVSEIREPGKKTRIWLGSFDTSEMAAAAYDVAAWYLKGSKARINFPDLVEGFPKPASADADDVRQAAQQAALQLRAQQQQDDGDGDSATGSILARVQLSPSDIQAINEVPLDSPEMWMEIGGPSVEP